MIWMVPLYRLDEFQREVLSRCRGLRGQNEWIQGFAGSGKSVLVVHLVQDLLAAEPGASVCIAVFTHALKDLLQSGIEVQFSGRVPVMTYHQFLSDRRRYDLVVVDEVQDVPPQQLRRIAQLAGRVIVAGDTDQTIYDTGSTAQDIEGVLDPRRHRLMVVHRLTKKLIDIVKTILPDSLIEGARSGRMQDVQVTLAKAASLDQELEWLWDSCKRHSKVGEPSAVLLPKHELVQSFIRRICQIEGAPAPGFPPREGRSPGIDYNPANQLLETEGVPLQYVGNSYGSLTDSDTRPLTYVMTYHSAKGLDFETVFLPHLHSGQTLWWKDPDIDRRLFFVGATRSRRNLFLSYTGMQPHAYVQGMPQNLLHHVDCGVRQARTENEVWF